MSVPFILITIQAILGGIDNFWHHEITEQLPARRTAADELSLHALREFLYAFIVLGLGWFRWQGYWAFLIVAILALEIVVTLADFVVEDKTRRLPAFERILHTVLALNYGVLLGFLVPVLIAWSKLPSDVLRISHAFSWLFTIFGIGLIAWSVRNAIAVLRLRQPPEWVRNPIPAGSSPTPRTVLISGATGFIGGYLVRRLLARGDKVIVLTRNPDTALDRFGPHVRIVTDLHSLHESTHIDAIVNLAGAPILGLPWTSARRRTLLASRVNTTRALVSLMGRLTTPVRIFVSASAIGFYGIGGDEVINEGGRPSSIFQSQLCQDWEAAARAAARLGARVVRMRIGLVLANDGGALPQLLRPIRLGLGAILGSGAQWVSWIHIEDLVRLLEFAIDTPRASGALNAVSPEPLTHRHFQKALAWQIRRPLWLRVPSFVLRFALGEMAQLLVDGQRVIPTRATTLGFEFHHQRIHDALRNLLDTTTQQPDEFVDRGQRRDHLERRVYLRRPMNREPARHGWF